MDSRLPISICTEYRSILLDEISYLPGKRNKTQALLFSSPESQNNFVSQITDFYFANH